MVIATIGCGQSESAPVACLPNGIVEEGGTPVATTAAVERAQRATLYLDLSLSMINFLQSNRISGPQAPLDHANSFQYGALVRRLPSILKQSAQRLVLAGFSLQSNRNAEKRLLPKYDLSDEQFRQITATECFANARIKHDREQCYGLYKENQRTDFSGLFPDVEARVQNGELAVIVSDLMSYGAGQLGDYNDVAGPLSGLLRRGYAVALLSAAVGYSGDIGDIPGGKIEKFAGRMPFHILIVGSSEQVATVLKAVDDDSGFRSFRAANAAHWHAVLFDGKADAGITLGAPMVDRPLPRGVLPAGKGLLESANALGQFLVARSTSDGGSPQINVQWPVTARNAVVPVEYDIRPDSQTWAHMSGSSRCEDGWLPLNDASLQATAKPASLSTLNGSIQQNLFSSGVPYQMAARTVYLWRLGWQQNGVRRAASEESFLKTWSVDAAGLSDVRSRYGRGGLGGVFPTFDLEALYLDLWQAAYGSGSRGAKSAGNHTFLSVIVQ
jgi:hypothetical protein